MKKNDKIVYAGLGVRFLAFVVDAVILAFLSFFVIRIFNLAGMEMKIYDKNNKVVEISSIIAQFEKQGTDKKATGRLIIQGKFDERQLHFNKKTQKNLNLIFFFVSMTYSVYFVSSKKQGTLGKQLFKLMIIDRKRGRMTVFSAFIRFIAKRITNMLFFVGYIPILFTKEKVALHDFLANSRVVYIKLKDEK